MIRQVVTDVAVVVSALEALAFVGIYARRADWRDPMARHIAAFVGSIGAVLVLSVIRIFAADAEWFAWARTAVFLTIPVTLGQRLLAVLRPDRFEKPTTRKDGP
jgi:hypothetical protein